MYPSSLWDESYCCWLGYTKMQNMIILSEKFKYFDCRIVTLTAAFTIAKIYSRLRVNADCWDRKLYSFNPIIPKVGKQKIKYLV